jgi:hypothetical protein
MNMTTLVDSFDFDTRIPAEFGCPGIWQGRLAFTYLPVMQLLFAKKAISLADELV